MHEMKKEAFDPMAAEAFSEEAYRAALEEVERLLPLVGEETPAEDPAAVALAQASDIVIEYEKRNHPIAAVNITS
jgi:antitoxin component HigA of HigAB toxin-antitoxin module